nr:RNA-directed DNA polymerase, eukaryota, reverse transcriptase zinc-binding domain protein [Tanacetum cinerariifolium]
MGIDDWQEVSRKKHMFRSKEDDVVKISTSIFLTNFSDSFSAKDLFHTCKTYGHVVDSYIPFKKSKAGKRFGFVRFINVFDVERLVNNLCIIWVGSFKLHANTVCFQKSPIKVNSSFAVKNASFNNINKVVGATNLNNSYVHVVKSISSPTEDDSSSVLVLDSDCLHDRDLCNSVIGRVKELASLSNLKTALSNEGFIDFKIRYMRELWVWLEFVYANSKKLFLDNVGVKSWFSVLKDASLDFAPDGRIVWIDDQDEQDDTYYHSKRICVFTKSVKTISQNFKIIFQGKIFWIRANEASGWVLDFLDDVEEDESDDDSKGGDFSIHDDNTQEQFDAKGGWVNETSDHTPNHPPGFTPITSMNNDNGSSDRHDNVILAKQERNKNDKSEFVCSGHFKSSSVPRSGCSILDLMEELVKVGNTMGYNMDGLAQKVKKDWVTHKVNFLALQERKMENIDLITVKKCWGNFGFDYVHSDSVGNSGGILCVWDINSFRISSHTVSDSFVMTRGVWLKNVKDFLIVLVYAPHDMKEKILLWDYLAHVSQQWNGEVIIMGDFNEVRLKSDRFGLVFNAHGANLFNTFIANAGLKEVSLGGSSFTWCHKSATKMSKLDRLYHHWMEIDGFDKFVEVTWKDAPVDASDAMRGLAFKLKYLKSKLREWTRVKMNDMKSGKAKFKLELFNLDSVIHSGVCSDDVIKKRSEVIQKLLDIDKFQAMVVAQKAKIKCNRFAKLDPHRALLDMDFSNKISLEKQIELEHEVSREELKQAVWDCGTDKSSSLDGFTFGFFWNFWYLIENDVLEAVKYFFCHGNIPSRCNSSFITLILKISDANLVKDFRPINLIGSLYKIIAKILSNRLVGVLRDIVNEVDFEKAFDSVRWDFLDDVLKKFRFGLRINMGKSKIIGILVGKNIVTRAASKLGCLLLNTPFTYLGTKVGDSMTRIEAWKEVINKVSSRLSKWKMKALSIGGSKLMTVNSKLTDGSLVNTFRRDPRSGIELAQLNALSDMVVNVNLRPISDKWVWVLEGSGEFTVASIRREIDDKRLLNVNTKTRWIKSVPIKVNIFAWKVKLDALPSRLNISRRGIILDSILCPICDSGVESTNHLFFECNLAGHLARLITKWWDIPYAEANSYDSWEDIRGSSEWRFPCREPDERRPSRPVRRAGISRPYYHYAFAMLLGSTLFVTFSRIIIIEPEELARMASFGMASFTGGHYASGKRTSNAPGSSEDVEWRLDT